jgi:hypothetical protein
MANPVFGLSVNEEYALEFGQLLQSKEFAEQLRQDIQSLQHPTDMTSHAWMWLLGWARSNQVTLQPQLLVELFDQWSSVFVKADIVDLIVTESPRLQRPDERHDQEGVLNPMIAKILERATYVERSGEDNESGATSLVTPLGRAEAALIALLQVGQPGTLQAAQTLLRRQWPGRQRLLEFFWSLVDSLEEETRVAWIDEVNPPPRPSSAR